MFKESEEGNDDESKCVKVNKGVVEGLKSETGLVVLIFTLDLRSLCIVKTGSNLDVKKRVLAGSGVTED